MINPTYRTLPLPPMKFQVISIPKSKTNYSFFHLLPITPKTNMAGNGKWTMNEDVFPSLKKKKTKKNFQLQLAIIVFWGGYSLPNYLFCLFRLRIPTVFCHQNPPNWGPPRVQQSHYPPNASEKTKETGWQLMLFGFSGGVVSIPLTGCWLNQPSRKNMIVKLDHFPRFREVFVVQSTYPKTLEPSKVANLGT